jgi:hypothetical protein
MRILLKTFATLMNCMLLILGGLAVLFLLALFTLEIWERAGTGGVAMVAFAVISAIGWFVGMIFKMEDRWEE